MTVNAYGKGHPDQYKQQPDALVAQGNPVSGTKYAVSGELGTGAKNARITSIAIWTTGGTTDPLEVHMTIDGIPMRFFIVTPVAGSPYFANVNPTAIGTDQDLTTGFSGIPEAVIPFMSEGHNIKIEVEATWSVQPTILTCRVKWAKKR